MVAQWRYCMWSSSLSSGAMLYSVGDHVLPYSTLPAPSQLASPSVVFSRCFPLLRFPSIIPVVMRCSNFSLLITWPKNVILILNKHFLFFFTVDTSKEEEKSWTGIEQSFSLLLLIFFFCLSLYWIPVQLSRVLKATKSMLNRARHIGLQHCICLVTIKDHNV